MSSATYHYPDLGYRRFRNNVKEALRMLISQAMIERLPQLKATPEEKVQLLQRAPDDVAHIVGNLAPRITRLITDDVDTWSLE